jgi:phenylacetate-CoA ligase
LAPARKDAVGVAVVKSLAVDRIGWSLYLVIATAGQRRRPYMPVEKWQRLQARRVRQIVRHAFTSVPFYREAMSREGLTPGDFQTAEDLARLPTISRQDLLGRPEIFLSRQQPRGKCLKIRTTGTSGVPAEFWHDRRSLVRNIAYGQRELEVVRRTLNPGQENLTVAFRHPDSEYLRVHEYYRQTLVSSPRRTRSLVIASSGRPVEENVDLLHRLQPVVVSAAGSYLGPLLLHPNALRPGGWKPRVAAYTAELPTEGVVDRLRNEFNILVQPLYRSGESLKIAFGCEAHEGLHIHPDLCVVTAVDDAGRPVPPGQPGELVISNLLNRATVLLNYRIGDSGVLEDRPCPCGRTFPRIKKIEGRVGEVVRLPTGQVLETSIVGSVFKKRNDVARYQIVQQGPSFEIRFQPLVDCDPTLIEREVTEGYRNLLGPDAEINVVVVDKFDHDPSTKWRRVIVLPCHSDTAAGGT